MTEERIKNALLPTSRNKIHYASQLTQREAITVHTPDGNAIETFVTFSISTETVEKLLKLIQKRAGITT